jgi:hypothetical protein
VSKYNGRIGKLVCFDVGGQFLFFAAIKLNLGDIHVVIVRRYVNGFPIAVVMYYEMRFVVF